MAQARLLSKKIILSRKLNEVSEGAENLYYRLLVAADDFGRFHADPLIIKGQLYTLRKGMKEIQVARRVDELSAVKLIRVYKVNGETYLEITKFEDHQRFRSDIKRKKDFPAFQQGSRIESVRVRTSTDVDSSQHNRNNNRNRSKNKEGAVERIVSHLNKTAGTDFKPTTKITIEHINARLSEGFSVDDLCRAIDIKVPQWRGDPKMQKYIRPTTLFNSKKFEGYLNESKIKPPSDTRKSWGDDWVKRGQSKEAT